MLQDKSQISISNAQTDEVQAFFVLNLGEVIGRVKEVTDSEVILSSPLRIVFQEEGAGFLPIGNIAAVTQQVDQSAPDVSFSRSSIVYTVKVTQNIIDAYTSETSGIEVARGNIESNIQK